MNEYSEYPENGDAVDAILNGPRRYVNLAIVAVNVLLFFLVELTGDSMDTDHMVHWGAAWLPIRPPPRQIIPYFR